MIVLGRTGCAYLLYPPSRGVSGFQGRPLFFAIADPEAPAQCSGLSKIHVEIRT